MRIRYLVTRGDLVRAQIGALVRQPVLLVAVLVMTGLFAASVVAGPALQETTWQLRLVAGVISAGLFLVLSAVLACVLSVLLVVTRKHQGVVGEHTLELTESGLLETTAFNQSLHRWEGLHKIRRTPAALIIHVTETMFHYVARPRPLLEGNLESFEQEVVERFARAPGRTHAS